MKKITTLFCLILLIPISANGFEFDGWYSGMSIDEVKKIARKAQLPIAPGSMVLTKYNETALNKYPTQRTYSYRTEILGLSTSVKLIFTHSSQRLYQIKARLSAIQHKPEGGKRRSSTTDEKKYFYESLYSTLAGKYGKAKKVNRPEFNKDLITAHFANIMVGRLLQWEPNSKDMIHLSYKDKYQTMMQYELTYTDQELAILSKNETSINFKNTVKKNLNKDLNRL